MTNGDKIRAMTNAELANSGYFPCVGIHCADEISSFDCQKCFCEWLDQDSQTLGMSNANFIRTATNKQLAEMIDCRGSDDYNCFRTFSCEECRLEWLNQEAKVFTNGDRIRMMSNEKLAKTFAAWSNNFFFWACISDGNKDVLLNWLNQEESPVQD